jgi:hypothetical protein
MQCKNVIRISIKLLMNGYTSEPTILTANLVTNTGQTLII